MADSELQFSQSELKWLFSGMPVAAQNTQVQFIDALHQN